MNPRRMAARGMRFLSAERACLDGWHLRFNKRAQGKSGVAYANVVDRAGESVEGVLYRLVSEDEIARMDPFEGCPQLYQRHLMSVILPERKSCGDAWVYVATQAWQEEGLLPERGYLNHLLAGRPWLSRAYYQTLRAHPCLPERL